MNVSLSSVKDILSEMSEKIGKAKSLEELYVMISIDMDDLKYVYEIIDRNAYENHVNIKETLDDIFEIWDQLDKHFREEEKKQ